MNSTGKLFPSITDYRKNDISADLRINIITFYDTFGVGQHGLYFEKIFDEIGIEYNLIKIERNATGQEIIKTILDNFNYEFLFVLFSFNFAESPFIDALNLPDKYIKIGHWAWELSKFPYNLLNDTLDEIWSISDFTQNSINRVSSNKVVNIIPPCLPIPKGTGNYGKTLVEKYNLNEKIVFSTFFDENSSLERKNPMVLLDIFNDIEFEDKVLIVKRSGSHRGDAKPSEEIDKYKGVDNIIFIEDDLAYEDVTDLYKISDVYVSTSKAEGQGRSVMEALQCGTKVFAVNYSAISEFYMNDNITFIKHSFENVYGDIYTHYTDDMKIKWAKMDKSDLLLKINEIEAKCTKNEDVVSDVESRFLLNRSVTIVKKRLHNLKKRYVEKLISNKLELVPDYRKSNQLYKDIRGQSEKVIERFNHPCVIHKYSYKNDEVVDLMNQYCIDFKNENPEYFSVEQEEELDFTIYRQRRCVFTTSNVKYISRVNVLAKTILKNHGDIDIYNVLVDDYSQETKDYIKSLDLPFTPIFLDELAIYKVRGLKWFLFQYDAQNSNTAAKPFAFKLLFERGYQQVLYFDCDVEVYDSLDGLYEQLDFNSFVLTPHFTEPLPDFDGANPDDNLINSRGQFNLGFIGISNKKNGCKFVDYWCSKTKNKFGVNPKNGIFTDQIWCNLIPSYYDDYYVERSFAYNIAYWNLSHRDSKITYENDKPYVNGEPVVFVHYSGVVLGDRSVLSFHQNVLKLCTLNFKKLHGAYIDALNIEIENYSDLICPTNNFDFYEDGTEIKVYEREHVLQLTDREFEELSQKYQNPFDVKFKEYFETITRKGLDMGDVDLLKNRPDLSHAFIDRQKLNYWKQAERKKKGGYYN